MEESFLRIEQGAKSSLYRCLFLTPNWDQVYECFAAFKQRFGDRCVYSELRYYAQFRDTGAVVMFAACPRLKQAYKFQAAYYTAIEVGPTFESRWEFPEDTESHLLSHVKNNSFMSERRRYGRI